VAFRNHLCAHQDIDIATTKRAQNTLVGRFGAGSVAIHAGQTCGGKQRPQDLFHLLRTEAKGVQCWTGASPTDRRGWLGSIAVVAFEGPITPVVGEGDATVGALRHYTAITALEVGGKAAPINQNETLFLTLQAGGNGLIEWRGNDPLIRRGVGAGRMAVVVV